VLPSHSENFGIAAAEALVAGVPAIMSDLAEEARAPNAAMVAPCHAKMMANGISQGF